MLTSVHLNKVNKKAKASLLTQYKAISLEQALRKAASIGYLDDIKVLLKLGADINAQADESKKTALHFAATNNQLSGSSGI